MSVKKMHGETRKDVLRPSQISPPTPSSDFLITYTSQSTARMREMSLVGRPTASRMMAKVKTPPAGMPAAPTLDAVAVTLERRAGRKPNYKYSKDGFHTANKQITQVSQGVF